MIAPGLGTISNKRCKCRIFGKVTYNGDGSTANCYQSGDLQCAQQIFSGNGEYHKHYTRGANAHALNHTMPYQQRHLLDDSVLETCSQHVAPIIIANVTQDRRHNQENAEAVFGSHSAAIMHPPSIDQSLQGYVRRKTVQKEGRKAAMASWQRYWLQIWSNTLIYFAPKSFKGSDRTDFRREPCKVCPLQGWQATVIKNTKHKNSFELFHANLGTIYKFRTDSPQATQLWAYSICKVAAMEDLRTKPLPANLMSFE